MIDPHVHLRDWGESDKETLLHAFTVAERVGISGLFEMPNTNPALTHEAAILRRLRDADDAAEASGAKLFHGLYAGITADPRQLAEIVGLHSRLFPRVVGFKLFAGHSTGNMGIVSPDEQRLVWNTLAELGYTGVVAIHAETEELLRPDRYDPKRPWTYGRSRPPEAEIDSIRRQLSLAGEAGFTGSVHFCHISTPEGVDTVGSARHLPFAVRGGVTPHHVLLNEEVAVTGTDPEWVVNPPLRDEPRRRGLWERLCRGSIDWIESDHAPHTWKDKLKGKAGLPGIPAFRLLRDHLLRETGPELTEKLVRTNVLDAFGMEIPRQCSSVTEPFDFARWAAEYPWNPYRHVAGQAN
jgi:dihydroorotase